MKRSRSKLGPVKPVEHQLPLNINLREAFITLSSINNNFSKNPFRNVG